MIPPNQNLVLAMYGRLKLRSLSSHNLSFLQVTTQFFFQNLNVKEKEGNSISWAKVWKKKWSKLTGVAASKTEEEQASVGSVEDDPDSLKEKHQAEMSARTEQIERLSQQLMDKMQLLQQVIRVSIFVLFVSCHNCIEITMWLNHTFVMMIFGSIT